METKVRYATSPVIELSHNAADTIRQIGMSPDDIQTDIDDLLSGAKMPGEFREECLAAAEGPMTIAGWNEYVDAIINSNAHEQT